MSRPTPVLLSVFILLGAAAVIFVVVLSLWAL
jgi:hypothetical protein